MCALISLGYQREVDALLSVNRQTALLESENLDKARELLQSIMEESGLFPPGIAANDRYAFVLVTATVTSLLQDYLRHLEGGCLLWQPYLLRAWQRTSLSLLEMFLE